MAKFTALCTVELPLQKDSVATFKGRYDKEGSPILETQENVVHYGDCFELEGDEIIRKLLDSKAICRSEDLHDVKAVQQAAQPKPAFAGQFTGFGE